MYVVLPRGCVAVACTVFQDLDSLRPTSLYVTKFLTVILTIVSDSRGHSSGLQSREAREIVSYEDI